ncbi:hypothetical protein BT67DRAFT_443677 [Trichocladium antarcticum]|uniref:Uncharacterized protein n=1 Tax=Trichocladium antarcticum TaxID=1450529 RepID=A0AAN6UG91_9PEZI|nr:hypothetical protein BT67DRAFT_443677 [Trichocladium antarcticum]
MAPFQTRQSTSHRALSRSHGTDAHTTGVRPAQHRCRPLGSVDGNTLPAPPGPLESMLKKTTETGDIGLFSIKPVYSPSSFPVSLHHMTGWSKPPCATALPGNGSDESVPRDGLRWPPPYRDNTYKIILMSESDGFSPGSGHVTSLSDDSEQRPFSMPACGSTWPRTPKTDGTVPTAGFSDSQCGRFNSKLEVDVPRRTSSGLLGEEHQTMRPPHPRLKLRVSRGALAKSRQRMDGAWWNSSDCQCLGSRQTYNETESGIWSAGSEGCEREETPMIKRMLPPPTAASPNRRWGVYFPETPSEILSGESRVNGKVLRRLKRRLPDLRAQLAEAQMGSADDLVVRMAEGSGAGEAKKITVRDRS